MVAVRLRAAMVGPVRAKPGDGSDQPGTGLLQQFAARGLLDRLVRLPGPAGQEPPAEVVAADDDATLGPGDVEAVDDGVLSPHVGGLGQSHGRVTSSWGSTFSPN